MKDDSSVTQSELGAKTTGSGTPAPWQVGNYNPTVVYDANPDGPISVATCGGLSPSEARANARRIVACVNACSLMPIEDVEELAAADHGVMRVVILADDYKRERDELVDALRSCEYEIFACLSDDSVKANPDVLSALQTAYDAARAALAKVTK